MMIRLIQLHTSMLLHQNDVMAPILYSTRNVYVVIGTTEKERVSEV